MAGLKTQRKRKKKNNSVFLVTVCIIAGAVSIAALVMQSHTVRSIPPQYDGLQIQYNRTQKSREKGDIKYIVIHDTDNTRKGADAQNHFRYFNGGDRQSSADFFVDDTEVLKINDFYNYYTWHCGDGGEDAKIKNSNSIGIEICVNSDGDYEKAVDNAVGLTREMMKELDIDVKNVVRHQDASGKNCPRSMSEKDWEKFKKRLK